MSKAKLIAITSICAALAVVFLWLAGLPGAHWFALVLAVFASVAVCLPLLVDGKNWIYSLLAYLVSGAVGMFLGLANVVQVAPVVLFAMPFAIVKARAESHKVVATVQQDVSLDDPFDPNAEQTHVLQLQVQTKRRMHTAVKWVIYYALLEAGLALTLGATYLFAKGVFDALVANKYFVWMLVALQLVVPPLDLLLRGCFVAAKKILKKAIRSE